MSGWEDQVADLSLDETKSKLTKDAKDVTSDENVAAAKKFSKEDVGKAGWATPMKYDYAALEQGQKSKADAAKLMTGHESSPVDAENDVKMKDQIDGPPLDSLTTQDADWAHRAARYEWKDEYGDVGPRVPELEDRLFRGPHILRKGNQYANLTLEVTQESVKRIYPVNRFEDAGLHPVMLENIKLCEYEFPTPIQGYCIPAILKEHDVIAIAQTGSGKTAAYLIPALSKLMGKAKKLAAPRPDPSEYFIPKLHGVRAEPLVLIIAPTRELSVQIFDEARRLCYRSMLRPCVTYGGGPMREQIDELARGCDILIGTPGRLIDIMSRGHIISFRRLRYTIIDEADELVGLDWQEDLNRIIGGGDNNEDADHRFMLFSATFPKEARKLAREYLDAEHIRITVGRLGSTHKNIKQRIIECEEEYKRDCLIDLIMNLKPAKTIIFVNSKRAADFVDDFLFNTGFPSTSIHSDRTQLEREDAIRSFKIGRAPLLVTTGVSARGLDLSNVMHVVNYDLPSVDHGGITEYLHRIGRTARMGNVGMSTSLYNERDAALAPMLVKVLMENEQDVPDFLEQYKPQEGEELDFEDASDDEVDEAGDDAWGGGNETKASDDNAWGSSAVHESQNGGAWGSAGANNDASASANEW